MHRAQYIVSDPEVMSGAPVFAGTRVPFAFLMEYLERGLTIEAFIRDYDSVTLDQALKAMEEATALVDEAVHARAA
jgi:uncharacterized protein (DUF433 family)